MDSQNSKLRRDLSTRDDSPPQRGRDIFTMPSEELASPVLTLTAAVVPYLLRLAAFHFAQRARWAAAIRLRAAADMVLRFPPKL